MRVSAHDGMHVPAWTCMHNGRACKPLLHRSHARTRLHMYVVLDLCCIYFPL